MTGFERALGRAGPAPVWRAAAVFLLLLRGIRAGVRFLGLDPRLAQQAGGEGAALLPFFLLASALTVAAFAVLAAGPPRLYLYAGVCVFWGLFYTAADGGVCGGVIYGIGAYFAGRQGFYRRHRRAKEALTALLLAFAVVSQARHGPGALLETALDGLVVLFLFGACRLALPPGGRPAGAAPELRVPAALPPPAPCGPWRGLPPADPPCGRPPPALGEGDRAILERIRAGDKYEAIAEACGVSPRTMDRRVKELYAALGVAGRREFLRRHGRGPVPARCEPDPLPPGGGAGEAGGARTGQPQE